MKPKPIVRLLPVLLTVSLIIGSISLISSLVSTIKRQTTKDTREVMVQALKAKKEALEQQLARSQSPEFIETEAREKLNMARPGETVILISQGGQGGAIQEIHEETSNWKMWFSLFY